METSAIGFLCFRRKNDDPIAKKRDEHTIAGPLIRIPIEE